MEIYMFMLMVVIVLSPLLKGTRKNNKRYVFVAAAFIFGMCALRGVRVGSDLGRYETHYRVFSRLNITEIFAQNQWNNVGFYFLIRLHNIVFGDNYHSFLFALAVFEGYVFARVVRRYSVNPYLSLLLYMALGYYTFIYSGLKQALATAFIFLASENIFEHRKIRFALFLTCATLIHAPAIIFLPAYFIAYRKLNLSMITAYIVAAVGIFLFRAPIVQLMTDSYETVVSTTQLSGVGGKVVMMVAFILLGFMLRRPQNKIYSATLNFMIIATILQLFAVFGNVFERLADYYFIFVILYLPFVFERTSLREEKDIGLIYYTDQMCTLANIVILLFAIVYYYVAVSATPGIIPYSFYLGDYL